MRILITNERLDQRAGSDLFVRDLARGLQQLGHFVLVYSSDLRERERLLERDSIPVAIDLEILPFRPDIIHARHHLDAMTAVLALPGVPAIHHCIGSAWSTALPVHPRIYRYVAPSRRVAEWIERQGGIREERIDVVPNAVDLLRFARVREIRQQPGRILIYDDLQLPDGPVVTEIRKAAADLGLELDLIGRRLGRTVDNPEAHLPNYDIVFANGRKAIEALACGCAVVVLGDAAVGEMVLANNFDRLRTDDFAAPGDSPPPSADLARNELNRYSAESCSALAEEVRRVADLVPFVANLERIYRVAITMNEKREPDLDAEQVAVSEYLHKLSPMIKEMDQLQKAKGDIAVSTASMFLDVSARLATIQAELDKPQW